MSVGNPNEDRGLPEKQERFKDLVQTEQYAEM